MAAIKQMRAHLMAEVGLEMSNDPDDEGDAAENSGTADIDSILDSYFARTEGRALLHLLTDPGVAESPALSGQVQAWCDDLRAAIYVAVTGENGESASDFATPDRLHDIGDPYLAAALGRGLLALPRQVDLLHLADPQ